MKRYILSFCVGIVSLCALAYDFSAQDSKGTTWYFDWVDPGVTCQLADRNDIRSEYNPNAQSWESPYNIIYIPTNTVVNSSNAWSMPVENTLNWGNNTIPEEITTVYNGTTVKAKVVGIGKYCFAIGGYVQGAPKIPSSIEFIGEGAFLNMNQYGEIDLSHVKSIGKLAFCYAGFTGIDLSSVEYIGECAFYQSGAVNYIKLGDRCKYIGDYAFYMCSKLNELNIPGTCKYVGAYSFYHCEEICPLTLNEGIEEIGAYAFFQARWDCSHNLNLPSTLKKLGVWAFMFNRTADVRETDSDITDIFLPCPEPPELEVDDDDMTAFGNSDPSVHFWDYDGWWMMPYLCLHVPVDSYDLYKNHPYWGRFSCIINDVVAIDGDKSIEELEQVGYAFTVPGESLVLNTVFDSDNQIIMDAAANPDKYRWALSNPNTDILSISGSTVTANKFGQELVLLYKNSGNQVWQNGQYVDAEETIAACVIVFVCPTVTIAYDNQGESDAAAAPKHRATLADPDPDNIESLIKPMSSYEHRVIYNSLPRFNFDTTTRVEIQAMSRGEADENKNLQPDDNGDFMTEIKTDADVEQRLTDDTDHEYSVVPIEPITNNRVIQVTITDNGTLTSVETVTEITKEISVRVNGHTVTVVGAEDDDVVNVHNAKGQLVYSSRVKTFDINERGVYVATVGDGAFKILVK